MEGVHGLHLFDIPNKDLLTFIKIENIEICRSVAKLLSTTSYF